MAVPRFTPKALIFLRSLKRHNDREWFRKHRDTYETYVRGPIVEIVDQLALDLPTFAPELVAAPKVSIYRIHRDTRFSPDKSPYKTQIAATFPHRNLGRHNGASLYFHVATDHVLVGGGIYAPESRQLYRVREHVATNLTRLRAIVNAPAFRRNYGTVLGKQLQRVPRGFAPDHPAAEYLRFKQFLAVCKRPASFATGPRFYGSLLRLFEQIYPFIRFLNEPIANNSF